MYGSLGYHEKTNDPPESKFERRVMMMTREIPVLKPTCGSGLMCDPDPLDIADLVV